MQSSNTDIFKKKRERKEKEKQKINQGSDEEQAQDGILPAVFTPLLDGCRRHGKAVNISENYAGEGKSRGQEKEKLWHAVASDT